METSFKKRRAELKQKLTKTSHLAAALSNNHELTKTTDSATSFPRRMSYEFIILVSLNKSRIVAYMHACVFMSFLKIIANYFFTTLDTFYGV